MFAVAERSWDPVIRGGGVDKLKLSEVTTVYGMGREYNDRNGSEEWKTALDGVLLPSSGVGIRERMVGTCSMLTMTM